MPSQEWERVAYISTNPASTGEAPAEPMRFHGHIESYKDDRIIEHGRSGLDGDWWESADEAIAWGTARAPIVLITIGNTVYSAGSVHAEDDEDQPLPLWPPAFER